MAKVQPSSPGSLDLSLEDHEAHILRMLCREMRTLLEADVPRVDPVIRRMFPDAYDDPADAEQYRSMVGDDLRSGKLEALQSVEVDLQGRGDLQVAVPLEEVGSWLAVLTDMRLAIGTRLNVTEDTMGEDLNPDDPDASAMAVMHWLGWLQEMFLERLDR